jgi:hypothetical protein
MSGEEMFNEVHSLRAMLLIAMRYGRELFDTTMSYLTLTYIVVPGSSI